ncbi:MAG: hypothetical protein CEN88_390 [Candidatus Berkelbacteria bacterium Licking1014_2]|uniref:Uncharacterized protein n=1 Tax=Candidatus Berkelbacteria bacterium Licking1014_2 TaxID=2017146 RepID=A0A554LTE3_9BACT|nr:MAG: hypothetical protein CEN88_390 [Candidatus Berkelbacteria bacterium Licking1014_2]
METPLTLKTQRALSILLTEGIPDDLPEETAKYWKDHKNELHARERELLFARVASDNWLGRLIQAENDALRAFFGQTFDLSQFVEMLERFGEDRISQWAMFGLEPHFLPEWQFKPDAEIRGWKIKPEPWFWQQVAAGNIKHRNAVGELEIVKEVVFDGTTLLIDTRCKPDYNDGKQMFAKDEPFLGGLIEMLRSDGKIARYEYGDQSSRFGVSSHEWDEQIRPALEVCPEFDGVTFRLELTIEANSIPQIYKRMPRKKDGQTSTWVWYEEFFEDVSARLYGGYSDYGGLARVWDSCDVGRHGVYGTVRPVGVLDAQTI